MDATTDLEMMGRQLEELATLDPAAAADLAALIADALAAALDELEEGLET
ncbi:MAG: hypothetical protein ACRDWH_08920 [Acidimicrobiia bacterium]